MDSYLVMAQRVLEHTRRPLTPRQILREAYSADLVPSHLFGKTQHKTLQARLSESIITYRDVAPFFRTAPGRFFVRSLIGDETLPVSYRTPIVTRRRIRDLKRKDVLTVSAQAISDRDDKNAFLDPGLLLSLPESDLTYVSDIGCRELAEISVWAFVVVLRHECVLTYRQGHYREGRDSFYNRRSVGFYTPIVKNDHDLFSQTDRGIVAGGVSALAMDLDLHGDEHLMQSLSDAVLSGFIHTSSDEGRSDLLGIVRFQCPDWFEPATRRLAMTDMLWHDLLTQPNHLDDYDPWSQAVIQQATGWLREDVKLHAADCARVY